MSERRPPKDQISIAGAPAQWQLAAAARRLVEGLRRGRFIASRSSVLLSISVVGSARMSALNAEFRGKRRPTDVLSFEQPGRARGPRGVILLGDLVLCRPIVTSQARARRHGVRAEAAVLLTHGLLHLLGFDHEKSPAEAARMARAERKLLRLAFPRGQSAGLIEAVGLMQKT